MAGHRGPWWPKVERKTVDGRTENWRPCKRCRKFFWSPRLAPKTDKRWSPGRKNFKPPLAQFGKTTCSTRCGDMLQGQRVRRQALRKGPNQIEKILRRMVREAFPCHRVEPEWSVERFSIDVFVHGLNLAYEADGDYWHSRPGVAEKDARRDLFMLERGIETVRFTETELRKIEKQRKKKRA